MSKDQSPAFRRAEQADVKAITDLTRRAYAKWVPVIGREPLPMVADYAAAQKLHRIDLAFDDDGLVGLIETITRDDHVWVENVAVAPEHQGRGLGRALLTYAEELARVAGVAECRLLTNEAFAANVALYQKFGYAIDRREAFKGGFTVYMSKAVL